MGISLGRVPVRSNWNLEMLAIVKGENPKEPEEKLLEQGQN